MAYDGLFTLAMTKELQQLVTGRLQRPRWRLRAEDMAVRSVRKLRSLKSPDSVANDKTD